MTAPVVATRASCLAGKTSPRNLAVDRAGRGASLQPVESSRSRETLYRRTSATSTVESGFRWRC
jgi:hypothetical protein